MHDRPDEPSRQRQLAGASEALDVDHPRPEEPSDPEERHGDPGPGRDRDRRTRPTHDSPREKRVADKVAEVAIRRMMCVEDVGVRREVDGRPACRTPPIATRGRGGRRRGERAGAGAHRSTQRRPRDRLPSRGVPSSRPRDPLMDSHPTLAVSQMTSVAPRAPTRDLRHRRDHALPVRSAALWRLRRSRPTRSSSSSGGRRAFRWAMPA